jgi:hypothetical protein
MSKTPSTAFQRRFTFNEFYSAKEIRKAINDQFPEGMQMLPTDIGFKTEPTQVFFKGLGEILFYTSLQEERNSNSSLRKQYEDAQSAHLPRDIHLELLIPQRNQGFLVIQELAPDPKRLGGMWYRAITRFEATDLGYILEGF